MRYLGGKSRLAPAIVQAICRARTHLICSTGGLHGRRYVEPFVGGGSVLEEVCRASGFFRVEAGDLAPDLILMWRALQVGWQPPTSIPYEQWCALKLEPPSALRGFAGFGASFGGLWFRAYARNQAGVESDETVQTSRRSVLKSAALFRQARVRFKCVSYDEWRLDPGDVVYCDPPYFDTEGYVAARSEELRGTIGEFSRRRAQFDHSLFWAWCHEQVQRGVVVLVSEFTAPEGWYRVEIQQRASAFSGDNQHGAHGHDLRGKAELLDSLWAHESQLHLFS